MAPLITFKNKVTIKKSLLRKLTYFPGSISYGVDLAVLSSCNHSIVDYGTFGLWAGLLAGGKIVLPQGYSAMRSPDMMWWEIAGMGNTLEYVDLAKLNITIQ